MIYRCKYSKLDDMAFIAHLDLLRIFIRSLRRASIPVNYSQGFSPHAKISFSPALGLGIESYAEVIDIDTDEMIDPKEMIDRLNRALPEGLTLTQCDVLEKANSIPTTMTHSMYEFILDDHIENLDEIEEVLTQINNLDEIIIMKKNKKKKEVELDVKNRIYDCYLKEHSIFGIIQNSIDGALKPVELLEIINRQLGYTLEPKKIVKIESYYIDGDEKAIV